MTKTEYIIWRAETREEIERQHPGWSKEDIERYLTKVEEILRKKGFDFILS